MRTNLVVTGVQPAMASVLGVGAGRLGASAAGVIGLTGLVIGALAVARSGVRAGRQGHAGAGPASERFDRPAAAMALGLIGVVLGALFVLTADGGLGTGNGLGGAIVAVVLGVIATALGGLARWRRRAA